MFPPSSIKTKIEAINIIGVEEIKRIILKNKSAGLLITDSYKLFFKFSLFLEESSGTNLFFFFSSHL